MSTKEAVIELIRRLPDDVSLQGIIAALRDWSADELSEDEWGLFVAQGLAAELNDSREDIYTLDDGVPSHGPR